MSLVLLEGADRTGKTSIARMLERIGFEYVHLSAPPTVLGAPGYSGPTYFDMMAAILAEAASRDLVMDRTHYGELIWPHVFGRSALLSTPDYERLREFEASTTTLRILMHDPDEQSLWERCVEHREAIRRDQLRRALDLYDALAAAYGFTRHTLPELVGAFEASDAAPTRTPLLHPSVDATMPRSWIGTSHATLPLPSSAHSASASRLLLARLVAHKARAQQENRQSAPYSV